MDCLHFDGQVVRLERIKDLADKFVRVRLTRIEDLDLNLFAFDYDLTFMAFFLDGEDKVYARYGGRDAQNADSRQTLDGLRYTMASVLEMHDREEKAFAPRDQQTHGQIYKATKGGCMHCHQVRERLDAGLRRAGQWSLYQLWRHPLPENVGL